MKLGSLDEPSIQLVNKYSNELAQNVFKSFIAHYHNLPKEAQLQAVAIYASEVVLVNVIKTLSEQPNNPINFDETLASVSHDIHEISKTLYPIKV